MEEVKKLVGLYLNAILKITDFKGRMGMSEFWWTVLAAFIVNILAALVLMVLGFIPFLGALIAFAWNCFAALIYVSLSARRINDMAGPKFLPFLWGGFMVLGYLLSLITSMLGGLIGGILATLITPLIWAVNIGSLVCMILVIVFCTKPSVN